MNRREVLVAGAGGLVAASILPGSAAQAATTEWTATAFHAARRFADLDAGRIAYVERGAGPAAIFLHGYPLNGFQWRGPMARLASVRRCIAPDLMGLGYSEVPADADLSPIAQAEMVVALMDKLGVAEAELVSNDSATGIAQLIAAHHPQRVRSLLLTNGDTDINSPPEAFLGAIDLARNGELDDWFDKQLADNAFARSFQGLGRGFAHPDIALTHDVLETYLRPLVGSDTRRRQGQQYAIAMLPNPLPAVAPRLRAFDKPVRIVWGRQSDVFPEERPDLIAEEARKLWRV
jgi:pimeloyl-ACP methyl ester carboxylesterase